MNPNEQDVFESSAKLIAIETVSVTSDAPVPTKPFRSLQKNNEDVTWKYTTVNNPALTSKKEVRLYKQQYRNISFKEARCETEYRNDFFVTERRQQQIKQSSLFRNYQTSHQVYRKKYEFGTSWIGKQQYFASVFTNSDLLANKKINYPVQHSQPYEDRIKHMMPCTFDSDFQSGNLYAAYKVGKYEYDLVLQNDFNTKGNTQWFYFRIKNPPKNKNIKLNIVNMQKTDSLFNYGMKPCIFSLGEQNKFGRGWLRGGTHIKYFRNDNIIENENKCYYTLSFTISTSYEYDVIRIAQNYPYTTLDLDKYLDSLSRVKYKRELIERQVVATTIGKNKIECVNIKQNSRELNKNKNSKPVILFLARQHSGETQSSYICQGVIDFLISNSRQSQFLRKNFEIKIIPMVNPDGVVVGNYRTNLYGYDLNRKWQGSKNKVLMESSLIKKFLIQTLANRRVAFVIDLHGHSRKLFSFFYGNHSNQSSIQPKIFPYICSKVSPNYVKFQDCQFSTQSSKRNTARVQLYLLFKSANIFTFETSFYGYVDKDGVKQHHTADSYRELGSVLCRSIYAYERGKNDPKIYLDNKEPNLYFSSVSELRSNTHLHFNNQQDSGSDSNPERYELAEAEQQKLNANKKHTSNSRNRIAEMRRLASTQRKSQIFNKTPKQIKFLELAQVNSIFPKNIIALLPHSFIAKNIKETADISTQTQGVWLESIKVEEETKFYNDCQSNLFNPLSSKVFTKNKNHLKNSSSILEQKPKVNNLNSTKNISAKEETLSNILFKTNGFRSLSQRRQQYQSIQRYKQKTQNRSHSRTNSKLSVQPNKKQKAIQTDLIFNKQQEHKSELRDTATSQQQKSAVFYRKYITVYNQLKIQRPKGRSSRFNTLSYLF